MSPTIELISLLLAIFTYALLETPQTKLQYCCTSMLKGREGLDKDNELTISGSYIKLYN